MIVGDCGRLVLEAVLSQSTSGCFITAADGGFQLVNDRWCEITGVGVGDALGAGWMDSVHLDDRVVVLAAWRSSMTAGTDFDRRFRCELPDGNARRVRVVATPVPDAAGETVAWVGSVEHDSEEPDPSRRHDDPAFLRAALVNSSDLLVIIDESATVTYVSSASDRMLGVRSEEWVGRDVSELLRHEESDTVVGSLAMRVRDGTGNELLEARVRHSDGRWRDVEIIASNLLDDPAVRGVLINVRDVTERRHSQRREVGAQRRFEQAFERSPIGMALTTLEGRYLRVNQSMCDILEQSSAALLASSVLETTHPQDLQPTWDAAVDLLHGSVPSFSLEKRFLTTDGRPVWTRATTTLLRGDDDQPLHFLTQIENIEERRELIEQLRRSALQDPLTGLANRAGLDDYLQSLPPGTPIGVIALDLDRFKEVNDAAGHAAGDEVLRVVSRRISSSVRPQDHAARTGGDEFVVVSTHPRSEADLAAIAARLLGQIRQPIHVRDDTLSVGASAGVAIGVVPDVAALMVRADKASYQAKRSGGDLVAASTLA